MKPHAPILFLLLLALTLALTPIANAQQPLEGCFSPAVAVNPPEPNPGDVVKIDIWFCRAPPNSYAVYYNETRVLAAGTVDDWNVTVYVTMPPNPGWLTVYVNDAVVKKVPVGATPPDAIEKPIIIKKPVLPGLPDDPVMLAVLGGIGVAGLAVLAIAMTGKSKVAKASRRGIAVPAFLLLLAAGGLAGLVVVDKLTGGSISQGMSKLWQSLSDAVMLIGVGAFFLLLLTGIAKLKR